MQLKTSGPACPNCGCQRGERVGPSMWSATAYERRCESCRHVWHAPCETGRDEPAADAETLAVVRHSIRPACPYCAGETATVSQTHRKSTRVVQRTYDCGSCGGRFLAIGSN